MDVIDGEDASFEVHCVPRNMEYTPVCIKGIECFVGTREMVTTADLYHGGCLRSASLHWIDRDKRPLVGFLWSQTLPLTKGCNLLVGVDVRREFVESIWFTGWVPFSNNLSFHFSLSSPGHIIHNCTLS